MYKEAIIRKRKGKWCLFSKKVNPKTKKRRNLGCYKTKKEVANRERQVQFFKRQGAHLVFNPASIVKEVLEALEKKKLHKDLPSTVKFKEVQEAIGRFLGPAAQRWAVLFGRAPSKNTYAGLNSLAALALGKGWKVEYRFSRKEMSIPSKIAYKGATYELVKEVRYPH